MNFSKNILNIEKKRWKKSCTTAPLTLKLGRSSRTTLRSNSFVHNEWNRVGKYRVNSHFSLASVSTLLLFDPPYFLFVGRRSRSSLSRRRWGSMLDVGRERSPTPARWAKNPVLRIVLPGTTPNHSLPVLTRPSSMYSSLYDNSTVCACKIESFC